MSKFLDRLSHCQYFLIASAGIHFYRCFSLHPSLCLASTFFLRDSVNISQTLQMALQFFWIPSRDFHFSQPLRRHQPFSIHYACVRLSRSPDWHHFLTPTNGVNFSPYRPGQGDKRLNSILQLIKHCHRLRNQHNDASVCLRPH